MINNQAASGNVYAVIIGIANYENKNIPNLNYSNRDAQLFAEYLQSKAGGSVLAENIRLLIDSNATTAAIYNSLRWLKEKCETEQETNSNTENTIYFYFSGHGDMESETLRQLGFLLTYNTPSNNYINNAVRLEDLNEYAHVLSVKYKAKVVLITDACHSGKLAGSDFKASALVGKELASVKENEIRIASCSPEELSNEHEGWGGGRGVFSYYLLHGLKGLADYDRDSSVTLNEIKKFLDSSISADPIIKENRLKQTPVANGRKDFKLASVNKEALEMVQQDIFTMPVSQSDEENFFSLLKQKNISEKIDFIKLKNLSKEEIPPAVILQVYKNLQKAELPNPITGELSLKTSRLYEFYNSLINDKERLQSFVPALVEALHTNGQKVINLYLEGDVGELERRRYYNSAVSGYDQYPAMYQLALKLTEQDDPLYKILQVNQYYFTGVVLRLKIPLTEEAKQTKLIDEAIAAVKKALAIEEDAAYIHNELGILYYSKKDFITAKKYFLRATEIAPMWALPWANLCGLYANTRKFSDAIEAANTAESLQPDLHVTHTNFGAVNELSGNLLLAEESYRKAIDINSRHFFPFERLGLVYLNTTQYALADSFFHEAELRKRGYHFDGNDWIRSPQFLVLPAAPAINCYVDTAILKPDDIMAFFTWGVQQYELGNYHDAVRILKKVIALDRRNPLIFHYMGKIFYDQEKWEDAELMFQYAIEYFMDSETFERYCDSIIKSANYPYEHLCFEAFFSGKHYQKIEDYYFIASVYEKWGHYSEAEVFYKKIIKLESWGIAAYLKLWRLLEKLERFTEAETIIRNYYPANDVITERELYAFYQRAIKYSSENQDPLSAVWNYKFGLFLYEKAATPSRIEFLDSIVYFPLLNREIFVDMGIYHQLEEDPQLKIYDRNVKGSPDEISMHTFKNIPVVIGVPGTGEKFTLAEQFYTPRMDAIKYLLKAAEFFTEPETIADINFKIGNVYIWAGSQKQTYPYYDKAVQLMPDNVNMRMSLINVCVALYKNKIALAHLNYLYDSAKINFDDRLLLAEFTIHEGLFAKGKKIIDEARSIHPYNVPETDDLTARMYLLSKKYSQAISFYKKFLAENENDPHTLYSIAKLYAQSGNKNEAWKWLERSMTNGFHYSYILKADPAWDTMRKTAKWNSLLKNFPSKKYFEPQLLQLQSSSN